MNEWDAAMVWKVFGADYFSQVLPLDQQTQKQKKIKEQSM